MRKHLNLNHKTATRVEEQSSRRDPVLDRICGYQRGELAVFVRDLNKLDPTRMNGPPTIRAGYRWQECYGIAENIIAC